MHNSQKCIFPLHYWLERLEVLFHSSTFPFQKNIDYKCHGNLEKTKSTFGLNETTWTFWFKSRRLTICWQKLTRWSCYNCCYSNNIGICVQCQKLHHYLLFFDVFIMNPLISPTLYLILNFSYDIVFMFSK